MKTAEQIGEQARAWIASKAGLLSGSFRGGYSYGNIETAYCAGFSAGLEYARKVFDTPSKQKPECPYCGATNGLRVKNIGYGPTGPEFTCEDCFTGTDDGPSFDDLPEVQS